MERGRRGEGRGREGGGFSASMQDVGSSREILTTRRIFSQFYCTFACGK